ncbi:MAG TPA: YvrJ family protein [Candidatus Binataceae bacterium]|jgi:hypothetical protein
MDVDQIIKLVRDVGFPIALVLYLLVRFDRLMSSLIQHSATELEILYQIRDLVLYTQRHVQNGAKEH